MNKLILSVFMLLAVSKSNGQTKIDSAALKSAYPVIWSRNLYPNTAYVEPYTKSQGGIYYRSSDTINRNIYFHNIPDRMSAFIKAGSDTLIILDTVIQFYYNKIRYIKIGNKVYPLKQK